MAIRNRQLAVELLQTGSQGNAKLVIQQVAIEILCATSFPLIPPLSPLPRTIKLAAVDNVATAMSPFTGQSPTQEWPGERWEIDLALPPMARAEAEQWISFLLRLSGPSGSFLAGDPLAAAPRGSALGSPVIDSSGMAAATTAARINGVALLNFQGAIPSWVTVGAGLYVFNSPDDSFDGGPFPLTAVIAVDGGYVIHFDQAAPNVTLVDVDGAFLSTSAYANSNAKDNAQMVTRGWTPSQNGILLAGDYLQVGSGTKQRLHKVLADVNSDSAGSATLEIFPRIRETLSDGTIVVLQNPTGAFRLAEVRREWSVDYTRTYGLDFTAVEAF